MGFRERKIFSKGLVSEFMIRDSYSVSNIFFRAINNKKPDMVCFI